MLIDFLNAQPTRGIAFNQMFKMKDYPHDILPLYAQGYSLAKFLIMQNGKRHFLNYIGAGMNAESPDKELLAWNYVTKEYYGFKDLSDLQIAWIGWVENGSREIPKGRLAANPAVARLEQSAGASPSTYANPNAQTFALNRSLPNEPPSQPGSQSGSWYASQAKEGAAARIAANRESLETFNPKANVDSNSASRWHPVSPGETGGDNSQESATLEGARISPPTIWR
jgi:hypothetical protein